MSGYNLKGLEALRDRIAKPGDQINVFLVAMAMTFLWFRPRQKRLVEAAFGLLDGKVPLKSDRVTVANLAIGGQQYRKAQTELTSAYSLLREVCLLIASDPQEFVPGKTNPQLIPLAVLLLSGRTLSALKGNIQPQGKKRLLTVADLLALKLDTPEGVESLRWLSGIGPVGLVEINDALLSVGQAPLAGFESRKE